MKYFLISEVSKLLKISASKLRYYDKIGLISPEIRKDNNYRGYSQQQIIEIKRVLLMRRLGFTLSEIKNFFSDGKREEIIKEVLQRVKIEISKLKLIEKDLKQQLDRILILPKHEIEVPFIENISEMKGIKIHGKIKTSHENMFPMKGMSIIDSHENNILFHISTKSLKDFENIHTLYSGHIIVKDDKLNKNLVLKNGKYVSMYSKDQFENIKSIEKMLRWVKENEYKIIDDKIFIMFEPEMLFIKKSRDFPCKISLQVD